jgi:hypothetical protein
MKPSTRAVLALLREQGVGTMRLAARVAELRAEGHEIVNLGWRTPTGRHVALYVLREHRQLTLGVAS